MPYTINGFGNSYYGKNRVHSIHGTCEFCQKFGILKSYDTTNYIVALFVPLIPIGRLRVINACGHCERFRCMPLSKWEESKIQAIELVKAEILSDDDSNEPVLRAIGTAVAYQDSELLNTVTRTLGTSRSDDPEVIEAFAEAHVYFNNHAEAASRYKQLLSIKNEPTVSDRLGLAYLRSGDPKQAEPYATLALQSGDLQRLWLPQLMVSGYQAINEHLKAMDWLGQIEKVAPYLAVTKEGKALRKSVQKGLKKNKPVVDTFFQSKGLYTKPKNNGAYSIYYFIGPAIGGLLLAIYLGTAIYKGNNQNVYVVNGTKSTYSVEVNGKSLKLLPGTKQRVQLAEGKWTFNPSPLNLIKLQPATIEISTSFFMRPFSSPIFVVNPDRTAIFIRETVHYAEFAQEAPLGTSEWLLGKSSYTVDGVDHLFAPVPESLRVEKGSTAKRSRFGIETIGNNEYVKLISLAMSTLGDSESFDFLENRLRYFGENESLLSFLSQIEPAERFIQFSKSFLDNEPVEINYHRLYQNVMERSGKTAEVMKEYEDRLKKSPEAIEWRYLFTRVTDDDKRAEELWDGLIKEKNVPVYVKSGYVSKSLSQGDFRKAAAMANRLTPQESESISVKTVLMSVFESVKEWDRAISIAKSVKGAAFSFPLHTEIRCVVEQQGYEKAKLYIKELIQSGELNNRRGFSVQQGQVDDWPIQLNAWAAYSARDLGEYDKLTRAMSSNDPLDSDLVSGNIDSYLKLNEDAEKLEEMSWQQIATLALWAHKKGEIESRDRFIKKLGKAAEQEPYDTQQFIKILSIPGEVNLNVLRNSFGYLSEKRLIAALLLAQHPEQEQMLRTIVNQYNFEKSPPYWLVSEIVKN